MIDALCAYLLEYTATQNIFMDGLFGKDPILNLAMVTRCLCSSVSTTQIRKRAVGCTVSISSSSASRLQCLSDKCSSVEYARL